MVTRILPTGRRTGLADPFAPSTDQPSRKWAGAPADQLRHSLKLPPRRVVRGAKPLTVRVSGMFEAAYDGVPIPRGVSDADRARARLKTEAADRMARLRSGRRVVLGTGGEGWRWVRAGRRITPGTPLGFRGMVQRLRPPQERGSTSAAVPAATLDKLAASAVAAERSISVALPQGTESAPMLTVAAQDLGGTPAPPSQSGGFQLTYLLIAGAVAWFVFKGAR